MGQYIDKDALVAEIERRIQFFTEESGNSNSDIVIALFGLKSFLDTLEVKEVNEKSETACRSKIIKVKCISPFDETWEKGKVYTGEKWHHGDLDMDFWDIYYDYGSNPKYVQFSSFEMLEKEFVVLKNDAFEVKEVSEELAETYMQVFEKKFPILPTLKGKQLDKFKNFLNKCQQIFGLQKFGIYPIQAKLFEKLALLWTAWGAENLQGIGQMEGKPDEVKEVDLEKEIKDYFDNQPIVTRFKGIDYKLVPNAEKIAKHFFELGLKAQKGE